MKLIKVITQIVVTPAIILIFLATSAQSSTNLIKQILAFDLSNSKTPTHPCKSTLFPPIDVPPCTPSKIVNFVSKSDVDLANK